MDQDTLLDRYMNAGTDLVLALDGFKVRPSVAMWVWNEDQEAWWFLVAGGRLEQVSRKAAYEELHRALSLIDFPFGMDRVAVVSAQDPLVQTMAMMIRTDADSVGSVRLEGNVVNGTPIPSALVYRLAPEAPKPKVKPRAVKATSRTGGGPTKRKKKKKSKSKK